MFRKRSAWVLFCRWKGRAQGRREIHNVEQQNLRMEGRSAEQQTRKCQIRNAEGPTAKRGGLNAGNTPNGQSPRGKSTEPVGVEAQKWFARKQL